MITDFQQFGAPHIISLILPLIAGLIFIFIGLRARTEEEKKRIRWVLAGLILAVRGSRYIIDIFYGNFDWFDLFSLHVCHIDLILLLICLVKPRKVLFSFAFLIGIPMGLAVALFPGTTHAAPGLARAMLFIMSHMMLVVGALYLAIVEKQKVSFSNYLRFIVIGNIGIIAVYFINRLLGSNYLYVMEAPKGTVIQSFSNIFGWPGYVIFMDALAIVLTLLMVLISHLVYRAVTASKRSDKDSVAVQQAENPS